MTASYIIATLIPLSLLGLVIRLGRLRGRTLFLPAIALVWGFASTAIVLPINNSLAKSYGMLALVALLAPIVEEICKAGALPVLTTEKRAAWFVDGAVTGFAAGVGFAIRENWLYLSTSTDGVRLAIARVTSTNLMHASTTALVGATLAATATQRWYVRITIVPIGLMIAIGLHSLFNRSTQYSSSAAIVTVIGVAVFAVAVSVILLGGPMSLRWARAAMAEQGLSAGEQSVLGHHGDVDDLLDQLEARFGPKTTEQVEAFIAVEKKIGILSRPTGHGANAHIPQSPELDALQAEANRLRRSIGIVPMTWLRTNVPTDSAKMGVWTNADTTANSDVEPATAEPFSPGGLWNTINEGESSG
ncbi:MAG: PrsW family glutamic-type intramembrane protease [Actinomycetes bacterium]